MKTRTSSLLRCLAPAALLALSAGGSVAAPAYEEELTPKQLGAMGQTVQSHADAKLLLKDSLALSRALDGVKAGTPGKVEAFVLVAGLDSDRVFDRETREAARVLARRYGADERVVVLSTAGLRADKNATPRGSISNLGAALAGIAPKMNRDEDVLILYTTSHGAPDYGIVYKDGEEASGYAGPALIAGWLNDLGITRRMVMISACYSGQFVKPLASDQSVVITAASAYRPSFGCAPGNDWTFFGDALINNAMRKDQGVAAAAKEAFGLIGGWEKDMDARSSDPQVSVGKGAEKGWLAALDARVPDQATAPVGKPAVGKAAGKTSPKSVLKSLFDAKKSD